jgi:hypothetical protein
MGAEDKFIEEIAKQLPVKAAYKDIARPAAKQTGQILEDLAKVLHLALTPVQAAAALQDRYRRLLWNGNSLPTAGRCVRYNSG